MKQSRFTEERIIGSREHEAGSKTGDVAEDGITARVLQMEGQVWWPDVSEARRLKILADEDAKLKKLLAEAMLGNAS